MVEEIVGEIFDENDSKVKLTMLVSNFLYSSTLFDECILYSLLWWFFVIAKLCSIHTTQKSRLKSLERVQNFSTQYMPYILESMLVEAHLRVKQRPKILYFPQHRSELMRLVSLYLSQLALVHESEDIPPFFCAEVVRYRHFWEMIFLAFHIWLFCGIIGGFIWLWHVVSRCSTGSSSV